MRKIERELRREFPEAEIEITNNSHYRIKLPNGRTVTTSQSPSCPFYLRKVRADVRRAMSDP
jgi:hypothetical protein